MPSGNSAMSSTSRTSFRLAARLLTVRPTLTVAAMSDIVLYIIAIFLPPLAV